MNLYLKSPTTISFLHKIKPLLKTKCVWRQTPHHIASTSISIRRVELITQQKGPYTKTWQNLPDLENSFKYSSLYLVIGFHNLIKVNYLCSKMTLVKRSENTKRKFCQKSKFLKNVALICISIAVKFSNQIISSKYLAIFGGGFAKGGFYKGVELLQGVFLY